MAITAPTPADALPPHPSRGDDPDNFRPEADTFVAALPPFGTQLNSLASNVYNNATEAQAKATEAAASAVDATNNGAAQVALAAAQVTLATTQANNAAASATEAQGYADNIASNVNFKGDWSAQTGAANVPYSVYHAGMYWQLLNNLADVTTSEPGVTGDWAVTGITSLSEFNKSMLANEIKMLTLNRSQVTPSVSVTKEVAQTGVNNYNWDVDVNATDYDLDTGLEYDTGGARIQVDYPTYADIYLTAVTNDTGQIDTTYWTDINSMTVTDTVPAGHEIYYSLSVDGRTTFFVVANELGRRNIVRNNAGTWEYNSNSAYASETWVSAGINTLSGALSDAMGVSEYFGIYVDMITPTANTFSVAAQSTSPAGTALSPDGTVMFLVDRSTATIYQYDLSTPFVITSASYSGNSLNVSSQDSDPYDIAVITNGTRVYIAGNTNNDIFQYNMTVGWDLSTASYSGNSKSVDTETATPLAVEMTPDGTKLVVGNVVNTSIHEYTLSTPYELNTAGTATARGGFIQCYAMNFSYDGGKIYFLTALAGRTFREYQLSSPYDLSSPTFVGEISLSTEDSEPRGFAVDRTRGLMLMAGDTGNAIVEYITGPSINSMTKTQAEAAADADFPAVGTTLDLAVTMLASNATAMGFSASTVNYDANTTDKVAIPGTDYEWNQPAANKVEFRALTAGNYKVRVI